MILCISLRAFESKGLYFVHMHAGTHLFEVINQVVETVEKRIEETCRSIMECYKDDASRAKDIALRKFRDKDLLGAKKFVSWV